MKYARTILTALALLCLYACQQSQTPSNDEQTLARAYGESLYLSDMKGLIKEDMTPADSALIVNDHVQTWLRDRVLAHTASGSATTNEKIERLVSNYRSSLLLNEYKQELLESELDTTVTVEELQAYYAENKQKYELQDNIAQGMYIKIDRTKPYGDLKRWQAYYAENKQKYELQDNIAQGMYIKIDRTKPYGDLKRWWKLRKDTHYDQLVELAQKESDDYMLDTLKWISFDDWEAKLPEDAFKEKYYDNGDRDIYVKNRTHRYFLKINKVIRKRKIAPMEYVQDDISKIILKNKKSDLISRKQEELYQQELENKNIEVY